MMALGMPAMGFYSGVVLIGVLPTWGILVSYASVGLTVVSHTNFYWIEPIVMVAYWAWQYRHAPQASLREQPSFSAG
jgi:hypothetical protein